MSRSRSNDDDDDDERAPTPRSASKTQRDDDDVANQPRRSRKQKQGSSAGLVIGILAGCGVVSLLLLVGLGGLVWWVVWGRHADVQNAVVAAPPAANPLPLANLNPDTFIYERSTGKLTQNNQLVGTGYSGKGAARNNPAMEARKDGPIPLGEYLIAQRRQDGRIGDMRDLVPSGNNNFGRFPFETFAIIPETNPPNNPPSGCFIVVPVNVFNTMKTPPLAMV
jgi:hypothetical protein